MTATTEARTPAQIPDGFIMPDFGPLHPRRSRPRRRDGDRRGRRRGRPRVHRAAQDRVHLLQGQPRHGLPRADHGQRRPSEGCEVHIFFTFWGLDMLNTKLNHKLRYTMTGNTAMHMPELGKIRPGLEYRSLPQ